ncbi:glucose/arabinose dehydrogenase [Natronocella acetinitrilica]|uniref:Glucose/arabinose dehydrogenase n=1 Tax=Natronocella acetinitrilica TaxID=414046 RepID=A0AAE3G5K9_9GAMM|nr:PQQ-dependent sugar dehydrogenase [Natronocella acetinitrilica]MCP1676215.1 glucose/arabinose dehydrogenase [Natronocella acetinitrilica]
MIKQTALAVAASALMAASSIAATQPTSDEALERMRSFQPTGQSLDMATVPQTGEVADAIRRNLERVRLPEGFSIDLYAVVPDARHMAIGPSSGVVFVGTRKTDMWAVTDRTKNRVADEVKRFAPAISFTQPGPCFSQDGFMFVAEHNRVLVFPAAEFFFEGPDVAVDIVVPSGELIPREEESFNHGARVCRIGPDNQLYISLGQPYNVQPREKLKLYEDLGIGGIVRMQRDGSEREVYARGVRNSVGITFNPTTRELWFTDNQVDGMGDDIPPGEINHAPRPGMHFGMPWYGGGTTRTNEYRNDDPPEGLTFPVVETVAHAADLGLTFYTGRQFPEAYRGGLFSTQRGSWNRTTPVGARVMFTPFEADGSGPSGETIPFAEGWLDDETGEYYGRIVDVLQLPDGSLLVSDDTAGAIYRISYNGSRD